MFKTGCIFIFFTYKDKNVHSCEVRGEKVKLLVKKKMKREVREREKEEKERE